MGLDAKRSSGQCQDCRYFCNDPAYLEQAIPGLSSMSSGYASVRAQDGLCDLHQRYLSANSGCSGFLPRIAPTTGSSVSE
jgi:hypothetical protein